MKQTAQVVLVQGGRTADVPGCHYRAIRGKYDLLPVKNRGSSRSKYGVKKKPGKQPVDLNWISIEADRRKFYMKYGKFPPNLESGEPDPTADLPSPGQGPVRTDEELKAKIPPPRKVRPFGGTLANEITRPLGGSSQLVSLLRDRKR